MAGNREFELQGVNHLALVCKDMARTVDFYTNVLGMPLIKTIDLPMNMGQHFFFDIGNGDALAFFWFPDAPAACPAAAVPPAFSAVPTPVTAFSPVAMLSLVTASWWPEPGGIRSSVTGTPPVVARSRLPRGYVGDQPAER